MARGLRLPSGAVLYPFLLALLPAVHFYEANFRIVPFGDLVRPALLGWVVVALVLALGRLAWRDTPTAAAVTAPLLAVIFEGADMGPWVSLLALVAAVVLGVLLRRRPAAWPRLAVRPLDAAVLVLVLLPLVGAGLAARRDTPPETSDLFAADVPRLEMCALAELRHRGRAGLGLARGDHHLGAGLHEGAGDAEADALRSTGHDRPGDA